MKCHEVFGDMFSLSAPAELMKNMGLASTSLEAEAYILDNLHRVKWNDGEVYYWFDYEIGGNVIVLDAGEEEYPDHSVHDYYDYPPENID